MENIKAQNFSPTYDIFLYGKGGIFIYLGKYQTKV